MRAAPRARSTATFFAVVGVSSPRALPATSRPAKRLPLSSSTSAVTAKDLRERPARADRAVELRRRHGDEARRIESRRARGKGERARIVELHRCAARETAAAGLRAHALDRHLAALDHGGEREREIVLAKVAAHDLTVFLHVTGQRARQARCHERALQPRQVDVGDREVELDRSAVDRKRDAAGRARPPPASCASRSDNASVVPSHAKRDASAVSGTLPASSGPAASLRAARASP